MDTQDHMKTSSTRPSRPERSAAVMGTSARHVAPITSADRTGAQATCIPEHELLTGSAGGALISPQARSHETCRRTRGCNLQVGS